MAGAVVNNHFYDNLMIFVLLWLIIEGNVGSITSGRCYYGWAVAAGEGETTKRSFLHYLISMLLPMDKIIFLGLDHMMFLDSLIICRFNLIVEIVSESEPNPNNNLTIRRAGLSIRLCHPSFLDQHLSDEKMLPWDKHEFCLKFYF